VDESGEGAALDSAGFAGTSLLFKEQAAAMEPAFPLTVIVPRSGSIEVNRGQRCLLLQGTSALLLQTLKLGSFIQSIVQQSIADFRERVSLLSGGHWEGGKSR
jgi:hypothetical protein